MFLKYNIPAFIWSVIILIILALPADKLPELTFWQFVPYFDKWVHFGMFLILAALLGFGFIRQTRFSVLYSNTIIYVFITSALYGGFTELIQNFVGSRTADYFDFFADAAGSLSGAILIKILLDKIKSKKFQKSN